MTVDREQIRRDAHVLALLDELEQAERERDEAYNLGRDEANETLKRQADARLAAVPALVEAREQVRRERVQIAEALDLAMQAWRTVPSARDRITDALAALGRIFAELEQAERERDEALKALREEEEAYVRQRGLKMDALAQLAKVSALVEALEWIAAGETRTAARLAREALAAWEKT